MHINGWSPSFGWVPRPSIKRLAIPKPKFRTKTVVVTLPKFDFTPAKKDIYTLAWKLVPRRVKYRIERGLHAKEVKSRFHPSMLDELGEKAIGEYIEFDWQIQKLGWADRQYAAGQFLGLEMNSKGFIAPPEKHVPIPPRSAMIGNGIRVIFDPESGEEVARLNVK